MEKYKTDFLSLHHCDCMDLMKQYPDKYFDLAVNKANQLDKMNLHLTACEIDEEYINKAIERIKNSIKQTTLNF